MNTVEEYRELSAICSEMLNLMRAPFEFGVEDDEENRREVHERFKAVVDHLPARLEALSNLVGREHAETLCFDLLKYVRDPAEQFANDIERVSDDHLYGAFDQSVWEEELEAERKLFSFELEIARRLLGVPDLPVGAVARP